MWHCLQFVPQVSASQRGCVREELGGEDTVISSPTIVLVTPPPSCFAALVGVAGSSGGAAEGDAEDGRGSAAQPQVAGQPMFQRLGVVLAQSSDQETVQRCGVGF